MDIVAVAKSEEIEAQTRLLISEYAAARIAMDYRKVAGLLHPDARYIMPTNSKIPHFSGECAGRDHICELMRQSDAVLEFYNSRVFDPVISGNRAAIRWETTQRNRGTGTALKVAGSAFITQDDGLIIEYIHYCDTATVEALAAGL